MKESTHTNLPDNYTQWLFGDKEKLGPELRGLRDRFDALTPEKQEAYLSKVRRQEQMNLRTREIIGHPDEFHEYTKGPATVKVYRKGHTWHVILECSQCHQSPCEHTGADFTDNGLLRGIFPKEAET